MRFDFRDMAKRADSMKEYFYYFMDGMSWYGASGNRGRVYKIKKKKKKLKLQTPTNAKYGPGAQPWKN